MSPQSAFRFQTSPSTRKSAPYLTELRTLDFTLAAGVAGPHLASVHLSG